MMAGSTGLEPAASAVTGQRSNQLNYDPAFGYAGLAETGINTSSGADVGAVLNRTNSIVTDSCRTHEAAATFADRRPRSEAAGLDRESTYASHWPSRHTPQVLSRFVFRGSIRR